MWSRTVASQLLRELAEERRRVVSDWRILIHCRRIARASNAPLPDEKKAIAVRRELQNRQDLAGIDGMGLSGIFLIESPFSLLLDISEEQIIQEVNPWAVFSHLTALAYHGLTDIIPSRISVTQFLGDHSSMVPLGTTPEDWVGLEYPSARRPPKVRETEVDWSKISGELRFGVEVGYSLGIPIYITDRERTLLDALRSPDRSGGIAKVLVAWRKAEALGLDRLIEYTDRFDKQILRQRVGYLLQTLGYSHPRLDEWRRHLLRGGSVLLAAGEPYAAAYSPEWNLSLNVPESALSVLSGG